ncbi:hypothetical protein CMO91_00390 [Candidatus Woesearchaeota archaeon]|nr:hypothetical protein [Candidatus Woesearchaeota archaeon]
MSETDDSRDGRWEWQAGQAMSDYQVWVPSYVYTPWKDCTFKQKRQKVVRSGLETLCILAAVGVCSLAAIASELQDYNSKPEVWIKKGSKTTTGSLVPLEDALEKDAVSPNTYVIEVDDKYLGE